MNRFIKNSVRAAVVAFAGLSMSLASCGDDNEMAFPFGDSSVVRGVDTALSKSGLVARGFSTLPTDEEEGGVNEVFTEDDILWFDVNTREIRFRDMDVPVRERCKLLTGIEFRLGNEFFDAPGTGQMFFFQGFYDDIASQHEVFRQKDSSEYALGDHLFDLVALPAFLQSAAEFQRGIRIQIDGLNRFM